jgi:predicted aspartyl protease
LAIALGLFALAATHLPAVADTAAPAPAASATGLPDAATIRRHIDEVRGTRPTMERVSETFDVSGLHGTSVTVRKGDDVVETDRVGPFTTANGTYHGQDWYQNENGQTVLDQPDPGLAVADPTTTTVAAIAKPVVGYVISDLNKRGHGTRDYVDSTTWRIVRRDRISATATTVILYDDFRTVAGYTQAWHWTARDGHPENDEENRIDSVDASPVTDADVAIPPPRRNLVNFPPGVSSVALPAKEYNLKFVVRVNVGTRGLDFLVDTGAAGIFIDDSVVRELGLKTYGRYSNAANAGRFSSTSAIVPEMKVGDLTLRDVVVDTVPDVGEGDGQTFKAVGLLGFDFIASLVLKMDYEHGTVTALDPASFTPPADPLMNALEVRVGTGQPATDVTINGALGERFIIDTGAVGGVLVFDYFARRHPEALVDTSHGFTGPPVQFSGVGGEFETRRYQLASVRLGRVNYQDFIADVVTSAQAYAGNQDGLIGPAFLNLYTLYTDYQDSMLYLVPNSIGHKVMRH